LDERRVKFQPFFHHKPAISQRGMTHCCISPLNSPGLDGLAAKEVYLDRYGVEFVETQVPVAARKSELHSHELNFAKAQESHHAHLIQKFKDMDIEEVWFSVCNSSLLPSDFNNIDAYRLLCLLG
jgi:hypothetical protein